MALGPGHTRAAEVLAAYEADQAQLAAAAHAAVAAGTEFWAPGVGGDIVIPPPPAPQAMEVGAGLGYVGFTGDISPPPGNNTSARYRSRTGADRRVILLR